MPSPREGKKLVAFAVAPRNNAKPFWREIGAVFDHDDGDGFTVQLDALPHDGRIVCRWKDIKKADDTGDHADVPATKKK